MKNYDEILKVAKKNRSDWARGDAKRDEGNVISEKLYVLKDVAYTSSEKEEEKVWHLTDIIYPKEPSGEKFPVIVSVHGGGWFYGDKELYRFYCAHLSEYGFAVVNFNYRLSPENSYPKGFMDVCKAFDFVRDNAEKYGFDISKVYGVGDSAGAQLLSQYCTFATSKEYRALFEKENEEPLVPKKIALNCGVYDMKESLGREDALSCYILEELPKNLNESLYEYLTYINEDYPETYLMYSVNDPLQVYTPAMEKALKKANVYCVTKGFGEGSPSDGHVFHVNMKSELGKICNKEEIDFFYRRLA